MDRNENPRPGRGKELLSGQATQILSRRLGMMR
jgi:hypothetical protein